jgi:purine-binding chemotaxis protein CheW
MAASLCGVFGLGRHLVGIPVERVNEMFVLPEVHAPPLRRQGLRGLIRLRELVLATVDLRVCLGLPPATVELEELVDLLSAREHDHVNWLEELDSSTREGRPFTLATDPRKCAFGRWYESFQTDNAVLRSELARIQAPHARVHALAAEVEALKQTGAKDEAIRRIGAARHGVLAEVVQLFASIREVVRQEHREIGVSVDLSGQRAALIVDTAEVVTELEEIPREEDPVGSGLIDRGVVGRMARWRGRPQPVLVLDLEALRAAAALS